MKKTRKNKRSPDAPLEQMVRSVDNLAKFEEFSSLILPALQQDLKAGLSTEDLLKKYSKFAAARALTLALTEDDGGKALAAAKSIIEHDIGKAKEKKEVKHQFEELADEEIDAALQSKLKAVHGED